MVSAGLIISCERLLKEEGMFDWEFPSREDGVTLVWRRSAGGPGVELETFERLDAARNVGFGRHGSSSSGNTGLSREYSLPLKDPAYDAAANGGV